MNAPFHNDFLSIEEAEARYREVRETYEAMRARHGSLSSTRVEALRDEDRRALESCVDTLIALSRQDSVQENMRHSWQRECTMPLFDRIGWLQGSILLYAAAAQGLLK